MTSHPTIWGYPIQKGSLMEHFVLQIDCSTGVDGSKGAKPHRSASVDADLHPLARVCTAVCNNSVIYYCMHQQCQILLVALWRQWT